jgi:hypothetical protein
VPTSTRPRRTLLTGVSAGVTAALVAGLLASAPTGAAAAPARGAAAVAKAKVPMPAALRAGRTTYAERSVPAYASGAGLEVRYSPGNGGPDARYNIRTPAGATAVWGDWDGNGTTTPAIFANGGWSIWERVVGGNPPPVRVLTFGAPGDRPVAGDWNGDGRTDIGVVRGNVWFLSLGTTPVGAPGVAQPVFRQFAFGLPRDRVVVGDWNGDRRDGIGIVRRGTWFLRDAATAGKPKPGFRFGKPGDVPVVGDWNADRTDTVGVVRGSTWYLRNSNTAGPTPRPSAGAQRGTTVRVVAHVGGAVPAPWRTVAGPDALACPTAARRVAARAKQVVPSRLLDKRLPAAAAPDPALAVRDALRRAERYLVGAQYVELWAGRRFQPYTDVRGRQGDEELAIRRPAMAALTVAVAARTGAHADRQVGRTRADAIRYVDFLVRSIACQHASVTPGGWGAGFQTAHWANLVGEAAWLVWDQLAPQTRSYVANMIASEANTRLFVPTAYWADKAGTILTPGNTHAEDGAWNAALLELAVNMMPRAQSAPLWRAKAVQLAAGSYSTHADTVSPEVVNGIPMLSRIAGSNIYDDGSVENHRRIHPDYSTNIQHLWWAADFAGLAGRAVPAAMFHNAALVYGSFTRLGYTAGLPSPAGGTYLPPGGAVYQPAIPDPLADIYYPQGSDWGTVRRAHFVSFDAHALAYAPAIATTALWAPRDAMARHIAGQRALSAGSGATDGRTYSRNAAVAVTQDSYPGREEYAAQQLATAWLALYVGRVGKLRIDAGPIGLPPVAFAKGPRANGFTPLDSSSSQRERLSP